MREAEVKKDPVGSLPISRAFTNCQGVQALQYLGMFSVLYPQFVYGEDRYFSADYYGALMKNGILRKEAQQFEKETEVWKEASKLVMSSCRVWYYCAEECGAIFRRRSGLTCKSLSV